MAPVRSSGSPVVLAEFNSFAYLGEEQLGLSQEVHDCGGGEPVVHRATLGAIGDQAALLQASEMPRDVRLGAVQLVDEVHDSMLASEQFGEDGETSRVAETTEEFRCHGNIGRGGRQHGGHLIQSVDSDDSVTRRWIEGV